MKAKIKLSEHLDTPPKKPNRSSAHPSQTATLQIQAKLHAREAVLDAQALLSLEKQLGNRSLGKLLGTGQLSWINHSGLASQVAQTAPATNRLSLRAHLEKTYGITIERGDKDWSDAEIKDLQWSLSKLTAGEQKALKGYHFLRWTNRAERKKKDPTYDPKEDEEAGLHETKLATKNTSYFKISMYDEAWEESATIAGVGTGKFNMLHEIGHAMEIAELRRYWESFEKAREAYNAAVDDFNTNQSRLSPRQQTAQTQMINRLKQVMNKAEGNYKASVKRTIQEFARMYKVKPINTLHSDRGIKEAFADVFALNKIDPRGIKRANVTLSQWIARGDHLK